MRDDQYIKLKALRERLIDHFLEEGDPVNWPGHGTPIAKQDTKDRGDAVWCKKSAAQTLSVAMRIGSLVEQHEGREPGDLGNLVDPDDADRAHEHELVVVSKEATDILDRVRRRTPQS